MRDYFIRRLLLVPLTLLGITLLVFMLIRLAPGGPVQRDLQQMMGAAAGEQGGVSGMRESEGVAITPEQLFEIEERHRREKGVWQSYLEWLGVLPRDTQRVARSFKEGEDKVSVQVPGTNMSVNLIKYQEKASVPFFSVQIPGTKVTVNPISWNVNFITHHEGNVKIEIPEDLPDKKKQILEQRIDEYGWQARLVGVAELEERWKRNSGGLELSKSQKLQERAVLYQAKRDGLLQGSLGKSDKYQDPVIGLVKDRIPISLFYGLISMILIYGICIPLGIVKAIKHRTWLDNVSSIAVFSGYAIPGYVLGSFLLVFLGARLDLFPLSGFVSEDFSELTPWAKIIDLFHHAVMPLACYLVGSFAFMTFMMKNNLMDNLAADYVRTATAKGVSYSSAVFKHAFRNSIIPIATTVGQNITLIVGGSFLIEGIFDINGFGLLQYNAILEKDEPVVLGVLTISATLMLLGNVISDLCVALVDPRIRFR